MKIGRGGGVFVASVVLAAACLAVGSTSCTWGSYDGSFDAAGLEIRVGDAAPPLAPPVSKLVSAAATATTTVTTADGVFEVDVPPHAYPTDVTITVTQLADRVANGPFTLTVPTYSVTVAPEQSATLPVQLVFHGDPKGASPSTTLLPVRVDGVGPPLQVVGSGVQVNSNSSNPQTPLWALVDVLGTFSLGYVTVSGNSTSVIDPSPRSCFAECCGIQNGGGGGNAGQLETIVDPSKGAPGCACKSSNPNVECFALKCPDLAAAAARCDGLSAKPIGTLACKSGSGGPGTACVAQDNVSLCCVQGDISRCGGAPGNQCGYYTRCSSDANCAGGRVCCAFDDESLCVTSCPSAQRVCAASDAGTAACDGGACNFSSNCGFGTCGALPSGCK